MAHTVFSLALLTADQVAADSEVDLCNCACPLVLASPSVMSRSDVTEFLR